MCNFPACFFTGRGPKVGLVAGDAFFLPLRVKYNWKICLSGYPKIDIDLAFWSHNS